MEASTVQNIKHIEISVCYETEKRNGRTEKLISVSRSVTLNGKEIYKDKMSPLMYVSSKDPLRNLERFLLGFEKIESSQNIDPDGRKRICLFQKIRRKLFGEKI